jgi:hypothetical protein
MKKLTGNPETDQLFGRYNIHGDIDVYEINGERAVTLNFPTIYPVNSEFSCLYPHETNKITLSVLDARLINLFIEV